LNFSAVNDLSKNSLLYSSHERNKETELSRTNSGNKQLNNNTL